MTQTEALMELNRHQGAGDTHMYVLVPSTREHNRTCCTHTCAVGMFLHSACMRFYVSVTICEISSSWHMKVLAGDPETPLQRPTYGVS